MIFYDSAQANRLQGTRELNIRLGRDRHGNNWFYGKREVPYQSGQIIAQAAYIHMSDPKRGGVLLKELSQFVPATVSQGDTST
jgi:hypothetical protein